MSQEGFAPANKRVLVFEGGKVDDPRDPGGRTNQGVIQRVYDGYRRRKGRPLQDVYLMGVEERDEIYHTQYWDKIRGDCLPDGMDGVVYDGAVNSGVSQSVKWAQKAIGVRVDGVMGDATIQAIVAYHDQAELIRKTCDNRLAFLQHLKTYRTYGKGWSARVKATRTAGICAIDKSSTPRVVYFAGMDKKANIEDAKHIPSPMLGHAISGGGIVTVTIDQTVTALTPLAEAFPAIGHVATALTSLGGMLAAGGVAYGAYATWKSKARIEALDLVPTMPVFSPPPTDGKTEEKDSQ